MEEEINKLLLKDENIIRNCEIDKEKVFSDNKKIKPILCFFGIIIFIYVIIFNLPGISVEGGDVNDFYWVILGMVLFLSFIGGILFYRTKACVNYCFCLTNKRIIIRRGRFKIKNYFYLLSDISKNIRLVYSGGGGEYNGLSISFKLKKGKRWKYIVTEYPIKDPIRVIEDIKNAINSVNNGFD